MTTERFRHPRIPRALALWVLGLTLGGCSIGPRFHAPSAPSVARYTMRSHPATTMKARGPAGSAQRFVPSMAVSARWWTAFHSPDLDRLMARGLRNSQTLKAAVARLEQARAAVAAEEGIFYPQVNGDLGASRQQSSFGSKNSGPNGIYSLYTGGLSVSYYPDIFGANRLVYRSVEAQAQYQRDEMLAAQLTLVGNIATTAILAASERTQVAATEAIIRSEARLLALTRLQYHAGAVPYLAVINQESQLATSRANLPALKQQLAVSRYTLATLVGELPAAWRPLHLRLRNLHLPERLPVSLPSELVRQRPDIRAALEQLRYANATIGIADAQFYPVVQLTASFGQESLQPDKFFSPASNIWSIAGSLLAPIFHGGTLRAQRREAIAQYAGTLAAYRQTVLDAFQQVASSLRALAHDAQALRDQRDAYDAARKALHLAEESYRAGAIDSLQLLTNEALYSQARIAYVRAKAQRYLDTVGLYTALGGGLGPVQAAQSGLLQQTNASHRKTQQ